jgi:aryl-alcohol dehydrogenase-like predicted oxidoreductase
MNVRPFGVLGQVSALSLGGGGIGRVYGDVADDEAVATVRAAVEAGIDLIDVAPTYGPGERTPEAEETVARAFGGNVPEYVRISSKVLIEDSWSPDRMRQVIHDSLAATLDRIGRRSLDLYILHSYVRPRLAGAIAETVSVDVVHEVIRPEFERLIAEGLIRGWGLTATAAPEPLCELIQHAEPPSAIQCVINPVDAIGDLWPKGLTGEPDNHSIRTAALARGIPVMAIRVLAAGALARSFDRLLPAVHPIFADFQRAAPFRRFADEAAISPVTLAYRYALAQPGVGTLVIGAKTRGELTECLAAEQAGPLSQGEVAEIDAVCGQAEPAVT